VTATKDVGALAVPDACEDVQPRPLPDGARVAVVASAYHRGIVQRLLDGALRRLAQGGVPNDRVTVAPVPGAFELPLAARRLAESGRFRAVVALGCVVRGDTPHFDYVCAEAARGVAEVALATGVPVAFGVLTCDDLAQAEARADGDKGNKGEEAAAAALDLAGLLEALPATRQG
jgi:6,7-dimethyl-8-ribityllumazine synthase